MNNELKKEEFLKLENRIWKTYQSRIKASNRILSESKFLDFLTAYYTISLSILSVFSLLFPNSEMGYFVVIISIIVMGMVFYGNSMNLNDRYASMKENYLKLGDLYYKCLEEKIRESYNFSDVYKEYSELLGIVENHTAYDYKSYLFGNPDENKKMPANEKIRYIIRLSLNKVGIIIVIGIPLFLLVISVFKIL